MPYLMAAPEIMAAVATDVAAVGSTLSAAHMAAATPTVAVLPAAADEVSTSIAHLFSRHAQGYQALAAQAAAFHEQFVQHLNASAHSYAATEAANAASLQTVNASVASSASAIAAMPNVLLYISPDPFVNILLNILLAALIAAVVVSIVVILSPLLVVLALDYLIYGYLIV